MKPELVRCASPGCSTMIVKDAAANPHHRKDQIVCRSCTRQATKASIANRRSAEASARGQNAAQSSGETGEA